MVKTVTILARTTTVLTVCLALMSCSGGTNLGGKSSRGGYFKAKHEPWREQVETACLRSGVVTRNPWLKARAALGGPGNVCGALRPLRMAAAGRGSVSLTPPATLRCPMVPATERWVQTVVKPAARRHLGAELIDLKIAASNISRSVDLF